MFLVKTKFDEFTFDNLVEALDCAATVASIVNKGYIYVYEIINKRKHCILAYDCEGCDYE